MAENMELKQCLLDLRKRILAGGTTRNSRYARRKRILLKLLGASSSTLSDWFDPESDRNPNGERWPRAICICRALGYCVAEFEQMDLEARQITELIGFGVLAPDAIKEAIGYQTIQSLWQIVHGDHGLSQDCHDALGALWSENEKVLQEKKTKVDQELDVLMLGGGPLERATPWPVAPVVQAQGAQSHKTQPQIDGLSELMTALVAVLQAAGQIAGQAGIHELEDKKIRELSHQFGVKLFVVLEPVEKLKERMARAAIGH